MSYQLHWIDEEVLGYYLSGALTKDFDVQAETLNLRSLVEQDKDVAALFENNKNMLILKGFSEYSESMEGEETFFYLLDENLIELVEANPHESELGLYVGIAALQYFQFDTLKDIVSLSEEDLKDVPPVEKKDIQDIQDIFKGMSSEERDAFLEQELFCYTEAELTQWLENFRLEGK